MPVCGIVFDVQRFSLDDGPGIRTVFFLKGCTIACPWCHNPESISAMPEIFHTYTLCTRCGKCSEACTSGAVYIKGNHFVVNHEKCVRCLRCIEVCPTGCCRLMGTEMASLEILGISLKDKAYFDASGGGVTFSGGEPCMQPDFLLESLKLCKEKGISTALETNGNHDWPTYEVLLPYLDFVMIDIKHGDKAEHKRILGISNEQILANIEKLCLRIKVEVRIPVIPGFNDTIEQLQQIIDIARKYGVAYLRLLPYHTFGISKYEALGKDYTYPIRESVSRNELEAKMKVLNSTDIHVYIG